MITSSTRRSCTIRARAVTLVLLLAATVACSSDDSSDGASAARTIEHALGTTEVPAEPERVVTVGYTDQDYALALGMVPVGTRDWFGDQPNAVWPWARDLLEGEEPTLLSRELNYEAIAALEPDVILAVSAGLSDEEHELLSEIAPTVAQPPDAQPFTISWQEHTRHVAAVLGREDRAEELVEDLEQRIDAVREDYPAFQGTDYAFASVVAADHYLYGETAPAASFLTSLGFVVPEDIAELTDNENSYFQFSEERFDLVDRPVTIWSEGPGDPGVDALLADPVYTGLPVHQEGRDLFLGLDLYGGAFSFSSVLSLSLLVDDLVPALDLALDGDPETVPALGPR